MMGKKRIPFSNAEFSRRLVNQLEVDLMDFRDACLKIPRDTVDPNLQAAIHELGIGIMHFIDQYRMTDKSIADINNPPGASKNYEEREFFRLEVQSYQKKYPDKLPSWAEFSLELDNFNIIRTKKGLSELAIESRTYDQWKQWWKIGEFDYLIHD
jgi:hypothetical protein